MQGINKQTMLDLIIDAKRNEPEDVRFSDWLAEYLADRLSTHTPPNEALTLEELREMDGEPAYVVPANEYSELGKWCVISIGDSDDYSCALVPGVEYWSWKFEGYGEQWLAYRRPPEGEADA